MDLVSWTFSGDIQDKDKPILIDPADTTRSLSFTQLRSYVRRVVAGLRFNGVQPGECVLVNGFNDIFYQALYFGIIGSGAVFTGVNPSYTVNELVHHMRLTKPSVLIVDPTRLDNTLIAAGEVGISKANVFVFDIHSNWICEEPRSWIQLLAHGEKDWVSVADPSKTVAHYASTSGTSGLPKAAKLSHAYHVSQAALRLDEKSLPYEARRLTALPPFHVFATPIVPSSIRQGHPTYIMSRFDITTFVSNIAEYKITETYLIPPALIAMSQVACCTPEMLQSLRQIWFGGAALKYKNQVPLYQLLHADAKIQPVWGMTEAGWITAGKWPQKLEDDSVATVQDGFELKIVGEDGEMVPEGRVGDVLVRSPALMLGYIDDEASTREALDGAGWLRTGDVGQVTSGKVYIVDRKKDLIKVRGWQVSPAEVENVIQQHPLIEDAAVIGVGLADNTSEVPKAYIVLRPGVSLDPEAIKSWVGEKLAKYKIPEEIVFTRSIPKNPTGKILRRILREQPIAPLHRTEVDRSIFWDSTEPLAARIKGRILMGIAACAVYLGYLFFRA